ncbi:MAG: DUF3307 domain-containing protein [Prevotella sp.]
MQLLLRLILAHIVADFFLQTDRMSRGKESSNRGRWGYLLLHSAIHALTAYLAAALWEQWEIPLIVFATHLAIDTIKTGHKGHGTGAFLLDQTAHLAVIVLLVAGLQGAELSQEIARLTAHPETPIKYLIAYAVVLKPTSIFMSLLLRRWEKSGLVTGGLPEAGKWIGFLERILILTFILADCAEAIGFLLAAKSIFRYGDLNKARDIKTTEYVLVGTLTSFTIAILTGYAVKML